MSDELKPEQSNEPDGTLTSCALASLIVDMLIRCGIVNQEHCDRAVEIAVEEIDVRKAMGDY